MRDLRIVLAYLLVDLALVIFPKDYRVVLERATSELFSLRWREKQKKKEKSKNS